MPALPSQQPVAVRHRTSSPTIKDHYPYSPTNSMGSINVDRGGNRQGASANSTSNRNPNSMYTAMSMAWSKEHWIPDEPKVEETPTTVKTKKAVQSSPRPSTPHGNRQKNFIERNKLATSPTRPSSILTKKSKDDSQPISPPPSLKQKSSTTQNRPVTPGANRPKADKNDKKKNDGVSSTTKSRRPTSPASTTQSAHSRSHSHVRVTSPEAGSGHGHTAHSRSHVRASTPEISLREEIKKLKRQLLERDDWLREKESELLDAEDVVEALQERVREVEARNRELQKENDIMRNYIEEENEKKKSSSNEPAKIINSVMNNIQRIRGESISPVSKPSSPTMSNSSASSPMNSPKASPALTTLKSRELLKANINLQSDDPADRPRVVTPQTRGNLIPANKINNQKNLVSSNNELHPPRPTAPSPAAMNRHELDNNGFNRTEMLNRHVEMTRDRQASAFDRKQAAALNVVMEESEDSEADEFIFERDDETSDDQADSEFDATAESENEDYDSANPSGINTENDDDDDDESVNDFDTHASSKIGLDSIVEEDDEGDEFEFEPQHLNLQKQKNWTTSNPASPVKNSFANTFMTNISGNSENGKSNNKPSHGYLRNLDYSSSGSDSGFVEETETFDSNIQNVLNTTNKDQYGNKGQLVYPSSSQQLSMVNGNNNKKSSQKQSSQKRNGQSPCYPHRDSMSSNSSDDSAISVLSSHNDSYPSSVTSPSDSLKSNNSYGQSPADSSNKYSSSNDQNGLNDNSVSNPSRQQSNNSSPTSSDFNNGNPDKRSSPNLVSKQFNQRSTSPTTSIRPTSPASSSRASTPSSNASTARAPSPGSHSSSRASTPSESSRNASGHIRKSRQNSSSDKCSTAIPPPPPPPANKDPFVTLQHYLRLISENSIMENPQKSYDIKKVIDEGSSAKVFTAHPLSNPSEECAIKVVPLSYSLEFIFNEIYVLKNLKHKNIVDFKESFLRWDGKTREVWIAMEKCARGDVTSRAGKINQREVGRIAGDLLSALKHLHANGVIHRDIKLSNILADANNEIKLADFGISSLTPTSTTAMVGTIPYMAPDVVLVGQDRPYDTKVDIWSLGVCILELLTGKAAWGRIRDDEIMDKLRRGEMPYGFQRLRKKADIGWEAVDFLEKCFIKTPENRWDAEKLLKHPFITGNRN